MTSTVDIVSRNFGYGSPSTSLYELFHGFSRHGSSDLVPTNTDFQGYAFFGKPRFNLLDENIRPISRLLYLTHSSSDSLGAAIRSYLMPYKDQLLFGGTNVRSKAVNDKSAFIPFLSNTLVSLSGWPDETTESLVTKEGRAHQVRSYPDSRVELFGSYDLTASFVSKKGDPHSALFGAWRQYMLSKTAGDITAFPDTIAYRETDFDIPIYMFVMGDDRATINKAARTGGGAYPTVGLSGASFDWDRTKSMVESNQTMSIPFHTDGVLYNDPQILLDFNALSRMFNGDLDDSVRESTLKKLSDDEARLLDYQGYPYIDIDANKLEWWLEVDVYNQEMSKYNLDYDSTGD